MAWLTPKTDWGAADGVRDTDMNRIESNILELYNGAGLATDRVLYVNASSGNDTTGDGTSSKPYATINKALSMLPRSLRGHTANVNIAAGTYDEEVVVADFNGVLRLTGTSGTIVNIARLHVSAATCVVNNITLALSHTSVSLLVNNGATFVATGNIRVNGSTTAVDVDHGSVCAIGGNLTVTNVTTAVEAAQASRVYIGTLAGSGTTNGIRSIMGSAVHFGTATLAPTGVLHNAATGGRIYGGAQANVPNY